MRTTITLNDKVLKQLKRRALDTGVTVSSIVEEAVVQQLLEDMEDLEDAKAREHESTYDFEEFRQMLKGEGLL